MLNNIYYFSTMRRLVSAFGRQFINVHVQRVDAEGNLQRLIKVPLSYLPKQKFYRRLRERSSIKEEGARIRMDLPRMGFEMTGMQYDAGRKLITTGKNTGPRIADVTKRLRQFQPVPYDFSFDLHIATKNTDDGLQIIEQIVPFYTPFFNLPVIEIPELDIRRDIPVILQSVTPGDNWEGAIEERRILTWTLSFVAKGHLYPPITDAEVIKIIKMNIHREGNPDPSTRITKVVQPFDAQFEDDWTIDTTIDFLEPNDNEEQG
jgi:hypothetical protein